MTTTYTFQAQSNSKYMSYNSSNQLSQSSTAGTTYQDWDVTTITDIVALSNPKDSAHTVFTFARGDNSISSAYQYPYVDSWSLWQQTAQGDGTVVYYSPRWGKYLGISSGALALVNSISSSSKWTKTTIPSNSGFYSLSINPGTTYYLQADVDGHGLAVTTSLNTSDMTYWWEIAFDYGVTIAEYFTTNYIKTNGDGTVSITGIYSNSCIWVDIGRDSTHFCFQSMSDGYLTANTDNSTIGEYIPATIPPPGAAPSKCIWKLTVDNPLEEPKVQYPFVEKLKQLEAAGFRNTEQNMKALVEARGNSSMAVKFLLSQ